MTAVDLLKQIARELGMHAIIVCVYTLRVDSPCFFFNRLTDFFIWEASLIFSEDWPQHEQAKPARTSKQSRGAAQR